MGHNIDYNKIRRFLSWQKETKKLKDKKERCHEARHDGVLKMKILAKITVLLGIITILSLTLQQIFVKIESEDDIDIPLDYVKDK